ncbi:phosphate system positive regulatory protein pho81 [Elasticomyces elasticus]|nr:phosphate system positive regulatory protein pho81 [Elasticomyces elasticus]
MKFGKTIQKRQLDIPEYAASFVDYKALKKLIKRLSATPVLGAQPVLEHGEKITDPQASLQANKATFFFRLERELEKVNTFYLRKEAELRMRLRTLLDKKNSLQQRASPASKLSSTYTTVEDGFRRFNADLDKLQQFVEVNATAFSKILKKWDKASKSRTKELYLSRAVEVQPCFNRDIISSLSDQATTSLLEIGAWSEGEKVEYMPNSLGQVGRYYEADDTDAEYTTIQAINAGNLTQIRQWSSGLTDTPSVRDSVSRMFLSTIRTAPEASQQILYDTGLIDFNYVDEVNERNCLHEAALFGRVNVLKAALSQDANVRAVDVYGRIPLHYTCMYGQAEMVQMLVATAPDTVDYKDLDNFTPLIHGIVHSRLASVQIVLAAGARVDPTGPMDHIPLNLACQYGSVPIVDLLLQHQPQILPDAEGLYPQHLVPRSGRSPQILTMLRNYGADLDQPDKLYQWTPLFHAASEGHLDCLQTLLQCGVNVDVLDEKDLSAMYYAAWEGHLDCMSLLAAAGQGAGLVRPPPAPPPLEPVPPPSSTPTPMSMEAEGIPALSLPPPIIPLRRYGHNFLDTSKTYIIITFEGLDTDAITFYGDNKYPAARLIISSKSSDLVPCNINLPVQEDSKMISFQIDDIVSFSIDFDIFPSFGSKVIARGAVSSSNFTFSDPTSSSGKCQTELFDPRLRAIGRLGFRYQAITPFRGIPLEISQFATYWKATSAFDSQSNALITGSSLSGNHVRLFVQVTSDGVPVIYPQWGLSINEYGRIRDLINRVSYREFSNSADSKGKENRLAEALSQVRLDDAGTFHQLLTRSFMSVKDALATLPPNLPVELHIVYPTPAEEARLGLGPTRNINDIVDAVLDVVFEHARALRSQPDGFLRSFVFSSFNQDICTALNWKQPNYPVLLCNDLGATSDKTTTEATIIKSDGGNSMSVKEAVRVAQNNNFMGLICSSRLLDLVPALIESIKVAGLVLISDVTNASAVRPRQATSFNNIPKGVDGILKENGVLRIHETIDM